MIKEKKIQVTDTEIIELGQEISGLQKAIVTLGKELGRIEGKFWNTIHERFPEIPKNAVKLKYDNIEKVITYVEDKQ